MFYIIPCREGGSVWSNVVVPYVKSLQQKGRIMILLCASGDILYSTAWSSFIPVNALVFVVDVIALKYRPIKPFEPIKNHPTREMHLLFATL